MGNWRKFDTNVLAERFELKRMDGFSLFVFEF
jgi:hypothetical protein